MTPEEQYEDDKARLREVAMIYAHECEGKKQTAIAREWDISQSRAWQIYHKGKRNQKRGLI